MSSRPNAPAELVKDLVEIDLVKTYHWPPQVIAEIPYKWLQKYYLIEKMRREVVDTKAELQRYKQQSTSSGRGQTKTKYRKEMVYGKNVVSSNKPKTNNQQNQPNKTK